jgi:hypothetical protein
MKQHILEHWIKLAQEIQEGLEMELNKTNSLSREWLNINDVYKCSNELIVEIEFLKHHYSDLNT